MPVKQQQEQTVMLIHTETSIQKKIKSKIDKHTQVHTYKCVILQQIVYRQKKKTIF